MLEYTSKETAALLISVAAALWLSKFSGEKLNILDFVWKFWKWGFFFINTSHNFQSKRQNMTSGVVCNYRVWMGTSVKVRLSYEMLDKNWLNMKMINWQVQSNWLLELLFSPDISRFVAAFVRHERWDWGVGREGGWRGWRTCFLTGFYPPGRRYWCSERNKGIYFLFQLLQLPL